MGSREIIQQLCRSSQVKRVAVSKHQARKPVHTRPVQILADYSLVRSLIAAVEQPVRASRLQMNSRSSADIQDRNPCNAFFGPMWMVDGKMAARNVRKNLHDS